MTRPTSGCLMALAALAVAWIATFAFAGIMLRIVRGGA
jgi:hypothetical protein